MKRLVSRASVLMASFLMVPSIVPHHGIPQSKYRSDKRLTRIQKFFRERGCPAEQLAEEFLLAADRHALDWRLLPSLSFVESSGGKAYIGNNIMGWGSARSSFPSIRHGVQLVASQLGTSSYYKDKDLLGKLKTYNPRPEYTQAVLRVMRSIGPARLGAGPDNR